MLISGKLSVFLYSPRRTKSRNLGDQDSALTVTLHSQTPPKRHSLSGAFEPFLGSD